MSPEREEALGREMKAHEAEIWQARHNRLRSADAAISTGPDPQYRPRGRPRKIPLKTSACGACGAPVTQSADKLHGDYFCSAPCRDALQRWRNFTRLPT